MKITRSDIVSASRFKNNSLIVSDQSTKTIMGTNTMNYQGRFFDDAISEWYLLNFRVNNNFPAFANSIGVYSSGGAVDTMRTQYLEESERDVIELPKATKLKGSLDTCLQGRHSVREYVNSDLPLQDLSNLLYHSLAVKGEGEPHRIFPRPYASGGGLYPVYLYLYINRVKGLKKGYYRYQPFNHRLRFIGEKNVELEELVNLDGIDTENFSALGFWVYERRRNMMKYGDLGTHLAILEAGSAMQNLNLVGYLLGIGFCELGGYFKQVIEQEIDIDGLDTHVIGCFISGAEI
ncbi:MAG TPA: SagB/ThcOx family dehydrogenase [Clostridiaceae bacterium]|nr:SagB/ThcOx family dehydrogenase [Clostridiaceae bacterium]